jgi:hypothetical protein
MRAAGAILILFIAFSLSAQEKKDESAARTGDLPAGTVTNIPVQAQYSNKFRIERYYFNRKIDPKGQGELLEIELLIENLTDDPMDLYIFTIATFEKVERTTSSFERPVPEKERIRNFTPFPFDKKNFEYENPDKKGQTRLVKYPKNPKAGVNPSTGGAYHLKDRLVVRTYHLSKYRTNYTFYNNATILIFDGEGKAAFRQIYAIEGYRR